MPSNPDDVRRAAITIALVSMAGVAYQVALVRLLSVALWYHFAFLVVSMAVLGFGLSGMLLVLRSDWLGADRVGERAAMGLSASICVAYAAMALLPFDPFQLGTEPQQVFIGLLYVVALMAPFFFAGLTAGIILIRQASESGRIYAADLGGAGVGALATLPAFSILGGEQTLLVGAVLAAGAMLVADRSRAGFVTLLVSVAATVWLPSLMPLRISTDKVFANDSIANILSDERRLETRWNAMSRVDLVDINGARSLLIDAGVAVTRLPKLGKSPEEMRPEHGITSLGFGMVEQPSVLILGSGGGWEVAGALTHRASKVTAVEINPAINDLMQEPAQLAWTHGLFENPKVEVITDEARAFLSQSEQTWDVIVSAHTISNSASSTGALNLAENYLMTLRATETIWDRLTDRGLYFVTRPEAQIPKLVATIATMLRGRGLDPADRIAVFQLRGSPAAAFTAGVVVVREPSALRGFEALAKTYHAETIFSQQDGIVPVRYVAAMSAEHPYQLATDDRPFFNMQGRLTDLTPEDFTRVLGAGKFGRLALEFDPVAEVSILLLAALVALFSGVATFVPLWIRRSALGIRSSQGRRTVLYFGALGTGYMFAELGLVHRLGLFLGSPTVTFAVVVAGLLLSSGAGAAISQRLPVNRGPRLLLAAGVVLTISGLASGAVTQAGLALGYGGRVCVAMVMIAPIGLILGTAFPLGMRSVGAGRSQILAAAWGVNGFASVLGSVGAVILATSAGFSWLLLAGAAVYFFAAAVFPQVTLVDGEEA